MCQQDKVIRNDSGGEGCCSCQAQRAAEKVNRKQKVSKSNFAFLYRVAKGEEAGQPDASNMRELVWDEELATIAQRLTLTSKILSSNFGMFNFMRELVLDDKH